MSPPTPVVLVVDDEDSHRFLVVHSLKRHAQRRTFTIEEAETAREAIVRVTHHVQAGASLMVLSDQRMPDMSGLELLAAVRRTHPKAAVRFVLFTSSEHPRDAAEGMASGADGFVVKPLDLNQFRARIGGILDEWFRLLGVAAPRA